MECSKGNSPFHEGLAPHSEELGYLPSLMTSRYANLLLRQQLLFENARRQQSVHTKSRRVCRKPLALSKGFPLGVGRGRQLVFPANSSATFIMGDCTPIGSIDLFDAAATLRNFLYSSLIISIQILRTTSFAGLLRANNLLSGGGQQEYLASVLPSWFTSV